MLMIRSKQTQIVHEIYSPKAASINPRPFSVFRHLRQWSGGGGVGATPPGVSKLSVVEISRKTADCFR